jgi:hypothetical protein
MRQLKAAHGSGAGNGTSELDTIAALQRLESAHETATENKKDKDRASSLEEVLICQGS